MFITPLKENISTDQLKFLIEAMHMSVKSKQSLFLSMQLKLLWGLLSIVNSSLSVSEKWKCIKLKKDLLKRVMDIVPKNKCTTQLASWHQTISVISLAWEDLNMPINKLHKYLLLYHEWAVLLINQPVTKLNCAHLPKLNQAQHSNN